MRVKIDTTDLKILNDLQNDGRMTNLELSQRCDISPPPCLRRVKRLERDGLIKGYHADINPQALGYNVTVFAQVTLKSQNDSDLRNFENLVKSWPMVRECYLISGGSDYFMKIRAKDLDDYQDFHSNTLGQCVLVTHIRTSLVLREAKYFPGIPLDTPSQTVHIPLRVVGSV